MMKRLIILAMTVAALALPVRATQIVVHDTPYNDLSLGGGEFSVTVVGTGLSFTTFCVERNENLDYGTVYNATVDPAAVAGGLAGGSPDPISVGSAYLYSAFANRTLTGYNYGTDAASLLAHQTSSRNLQFAFWYLEDEMTFAQAGGLSNPFLAKVEGMFADPKADNNGQYLASILNITDGAGGLKQSLLTAPDGGLTVMLLGAALTGLAFVTRRQS